MGRTRYVSRCDLRIAYELRGTLHRRRPWLVLIQGMGLDRSGWQPVLRKLRRHFRLVLVDNRASGLSDRPSRRFTVADMAGDVGAVLDAARVGRPHVLGASLGGMVAQELAVHYSSGSTVSCWRAPPRAGPLLIPCRGPPHAGGHGPADGGDHRPDRRSIDAPSHR